MKKHTFEVQVLDGEWIGCVREDLLDDYDGETAKLPPAQFDTRERAEQFIDDLRGLMHIGGGDTQFRIVVVR